MRNVLRLQGKVIVFASALMWGASSAAQEPFGEGGTRPLNEAITFQAVSPPDRIQWSWTVQELGTKFLRLRFADINDNSSVDYTVVIRDRNGLELQKLTKAEFGVQHEFWTKLLEGDYARVEVVGDSSPIGLTFGLKELAFQKPKAVIYSIVGGGLESISVYRNIPQLFGPSRAVAKLSFIKNTISYTCTGFLVSDDTMMTNQHCIGTKEVCRTAMALFGYQVGDNGILDFGEQYRCLSLIDADEPLDAALIKLEGKPGAKWGHLELTRRAPEQDEATFIIQHPGGQAKQIARNKCYISTPVADGRAPKVDMGHKCDTADGSSGSPIIGLDYKVVGLHHWGFQSDDIRWAGENRGVRMLGIMDRLKLP